MTISPLATQTILTQNCTSPRNHKIDRITPHYMVWFCTAETCAESFVPRSRKASSNYCIGKYGDICCNVIEENRAWTSGSAENDNRAITSECANHMETANGHVYGQLPNATWDSLVKLCADVAKRYGFKRVVYTGSTRNGDPEAILLTKHRWFQNTDCPGPWLDGQFERLAREATALVGAPSVTGFGGVYRCRVLSLNVRDKPSLKGKVVAEYVLGQIVELDDWWIVADGYVWGKYTAYSGKERYVAVGRYTGKVEDDDFLVRV